MLSVLVMGSQPAECNRVATIERVYVEGGDNISNLRLGRRRTACELTCCYGEPVKIEDVSDREGEASLVIEETFIGSGGIDTGGVFKKYSKNQSVLFTIFSGSNRF